MKKLSTFLVAVLAIFVFSTFAFAGSGAPPITETVPVYAEVACYVELTVIDPPDMLSFSGAPNETQSTTFITNKKTNCDVNYNVKITKNLQRIGGGSTINLYLGYVGNTEYNLFNEAGSEYNDIFTLIGVTGSTSPLAGDYEGEVTLTVTMI